MSDDGKRSRPKVRPQFAQFEKTRKCRYFDAGHCLWGANCLHAHGDHELVDVPNLYKTKICERFQRGKCDRGEYCQFAHGRGELRSTHAFFKTQMCNRGARCLTWGCRFAHSPDELRAPADAARGEADEPNRARGASWENAASPASAALAVRTAAERRAARRRTARTASDISGTDAPDGEHNDRGPGSAVERQDAAAEEAHDDLWRAGWEMEQQIQLGPAPVHLNAATGAGLAAAVFQPLYGVPAAPGAFVWVPHGAAVLCTGNAVAAPPVWYVP